MNDKLYKVRIEMYVAAHNKETAAQIAIRWSDSDSVDIEVSDASKGIAEDWLDCVPIGGDGSKKCKDYLK